MAIYRNNVVYVVIVIACKTQNVSSSFFFMIVYAIVLDKSFSTVIKDIDHAFKPRVVSLSPILIAYDTTGKAMYIIESELLFKICVHL